MTSFSFVSYQYLAHTFQACESIAVHLHRWLLYQTLIEDSELLEYRDKLYSF